MKNLKKLNRKELSTLKGALTCGGCPTHATYGPGPEYMYSCETYWNLPNNCKACVLVSADCFPQ
ncbi:bacteriocin-like protein [Chryseobacterium defluvii]|uniref:Uncharacterized protein n=1 Tax=Chryseobacterium defluvii TaxID=160396 RepID=A0A495SMA3_9FLAO|nr:hypothetical protein [Chryseobacterium defluvii]RKT01177.1 hypothetical protein BCF58_0393 [Chryseobacterium defluvii]